MCFFSSRIWWFGDKDKPQLFTHSRIIQVLPKWYVIILSQLVTQVVCGIYLCTTLLLTPFKYSTCIHLKNNHVAQKSSLLYHLKKKTKVNIQERFTTCFFFGFWFGYPPTAVTVTHHQRGMRSWSLPAIWPSRRSLLVGPGLWWMLFKGFGKGGAVLAKLILYYIPYISGWWFQIFFIFTPICGRFPFWLIFFKWVETTNQIYMFWII